MEQLMIGWAVIISALSIAVALIAAAASHAPSTVRRVWDADTDTIPVVPSSIHSVDDTVVIRTAEPLLIDTRFIPDPDVVTDLLGEWRPNDHALAEPVLLGHVVHSHDWGTGTYELVGAR